MINIVSEINFNITLAAYCLHSANQLVQKIHLGGGRINSLTPEAKTDKVKSKNDTCKIMEGGLQNASR